MKIFLFSTGFNDFVIELANGLSTNNKVILVLPDATIRTKEYISFLSDRVIFEPVKLPRLRDLYRNFVFMKNILNLIDKHNPDIINIQSHGHMYFFLIFPFIKKPIVNTIHDAKPHYGDLHTKSYKIAPLFGNIFSNHFITHSEYTKNILVQNSKIVSDKISVVPLSNPFIQNRSDKLIELTGNKKILFMGRIWRYKGLHVLINAEPYISRHFSNYNIIIAGVGENLEKYKNLIVNKEKYLIRNERLSFEELIELVKSSDFLVLPYLEATQSGIVNLANSLGKPVICTDVGGLPEQVINMKTGIIVPPNNPKKLALSILQLLRNPQLIRKLGKNALNYVLQNSSRDNVASLTARAYRRTLNHEV